MINSETIFTFIVILSVLTIAVICLLTYVINTVITNDVKNEENYKSLKEQLNELRNSNNIILQYFKKLNNKEPLFTVEEVEFIPLKVILKGNKERIKIIADLYDKVEYGEFKILDRILLHGMSTKEFEHKLYQIEEYFKKSLIYDKDFYTSLTQEQLKDLKL